jgi:FkbM family methyltransferase
MRTAAGLVRFVLSHPITRHRRLAALVRALRWQLAARLGRAAVVAVGDARFHCRRGRAAVTGFLYVGLPEYHEMHYVMALLDEGDLFVDGGANLGGYTILAARLRGARVVAIEPDAEAAACLTENIALNGVGEAVQVVQSALGAATGRGTLTQGLDTVNHLTAEGEGAPVQLRTLDDIVGDDRPALVKLDIEGSEGQALRGGRRLLSGDEAPDVLVELNEGARMFGESPGSIAALLHELGYELFEFADAGLAAWAPPAHPRTGNLLATKRPDRALALRHVYADAHLTPTFELV